MLGEGLSRKGGWKGKRTGIIILVMPGWTNQTDGVLNQWQTTTLHIYNTKQYIFTTQNKPQVVHCIYSIWIQHNVSPCLTPRFTDVGLCQNPPCTVCWHDRCWWQEAKKEDMVTLTSDINETIHDNSAGWTLEGHIIKLKVHITFIKDNLVITSEQKCLLSG